MTKRNKKKNLIDYRYDIRGKSLEIILKSRKSFILVVEGKTDKIVYRPMLKDEKIDVISSGIKKNPGSKKFVKKISQIIGIIEPKNKNVAFLVDKDRDNFHEEKNLFMTDFYSLENYPIVYDERNKFFEDINHEKFLETRILLAKSIHPEAIEKNLPIGDNEEDLKRNYEKVEFKDPPLEEKKINILMFSRGKLLWNILIKEKYKKQPKIERNQIYYDQIVKYDVLERIKEHFKGIGK